MKLVALKDVCRITNGGTPKSGVAEFWHGDVAWLTPAEMGKRKSPDIGETARTISRAGLANSSAKLIPANSVILSTRAPIGHLAINQVPMAFNQGCRGLTPGDRLNTKFLYYFLLLSREALDGLGTGTTFKELSSSSLANFQIPLPPLNEQRRIVAVLDKTFAAIATATASAQKNSNNARALFESELDGEIQQAQANFDGQALGDVCIRVTVGHVGPMKTRYFSSGIPFLRSQNVRPFKLALENVLYIDDAFDAELKKSRLQAGDVAVVRTGYPGTAAVIPENLLQANCADLVIIKPSDALNPHYLAAILNSNTGKVSVAGRLNGAAQKHFNVGAAKKMKIAVPSLAEQQRIVDRIRLIDAKSQLLSDIYQCKLTSLAELKQSLLQKAFAGELTATVTQTVTPAANDNFATPQFTAQVLAFAYRRHEQKQKQRTFGHVKAQKTLHLVESVGGISLGRQPIKDAAGPNDMQHMLRATDWAVQQGFFEFVPRANGKGYDFKKLANYDACWAEAEAVIKPVANELTRAIDLIVDSPSDFAELIATTHAAWNNLIIDNATITDDAVVLAARDNWHVSKLRFDPSRFHDAIRFIRTNGIIPDGSAKYVGGQGSLL